jgi:hypothetical protein
MANTKFVETLENMKYSTRRVPEAPYAYSNDNGNILYS